MKHEWILTANASRARLYGRDAPDEALKEMQTLEHAESRLRTSDLSSDHAGHENADQHHGGGVSFAPRTDPRRKEHQRFAQEIALRLSEGVRTGRCTALTICASSPFLGELRAALDEPTRQVLRASVDVDLSACGAAELERRLASLAAG
ncbi:host attachment protein [Azohydromonas caseinilytica]|uniref:Host attachment protein n=1 Tax=Azohydromonas caseinilytica TaxID=2728836 RepID=A0A848FIV1_9BURK|nr:host attachment protein [Azohydromonas caseinilytica]NML18209.1 host attachment protein [Azohydromonas caseinilytica]